MYLYVKRALDIVLALVALIIFSPLFLVISVAIKLESKGPVFFKQERVGIHNTTFIMFKFRTMSVDTPKYKPTYALSNPYDHITRVGKTLRKTSLDELPQLINILVGQMSVIGPRPVIKEETELIQERGKYGVYEVLPGLTGWAQINGRDCLTPWVKARMDGEYVERISFSFDVRCLVGTVIVIFKRSGVVEGRSREFDMAMAEVAATAERVRSKVG